MNAALRYSRERKAFERPIFDFQAIQFKMAEMATKVDAAQLLILKAALLKQEGKPYGKQAAMAKLLRFENRR